jgi:Low-density lipoprotein receptor domain class A
MRARAYGIVFIAIATSSCITISDDNDDDKTKGTTEAQAAEALTKAVSFQGGTLIDGLMPESSTSDVSLIPDDGGKIVPGEASLMSFDIAPDDANVNAALVQFEGAGSHFLVDPEAFDGMLDGGASDAATGDGGIGSAGAALVTSGRANLVFSVEDDVCADLCDREYEIPVLQALQLADKGKPVTEHQTATFILDCSGIGDHAKCGESAVTEGDAGGNTPAASGAAEKLVGSYFALQAAICECTGAVTDSSGSGSKACSQTDADQACAVKAFMENAKLAAKEMACAQAYLDEQSVCVEMSMCSAAQLSTCDIVASSSQSSSGSSGEAGAGASTEPPSEDSDPITAKCGAWPDALQTDLDACGGTPSGGFTCADGTSLSTSQRCDGTRDCTDGSDESGCGGVVDATFACGDEAGTQVSQQQVCDGVPDCPIADQSIGAPDEAPGVCMPIDAGVPAADGGNTAGAAAAPTAGAGSDRADAGF